MPDFRRFDLSNVTVATVLPFLDNGEIDWDGYGNVIDYCLIPGVGGIFVNGHAGEGATLTRAERLKVIEFTRDRVGSDRPIMAGIISFGTADAIEQTGEALAAGCDIPVIFPPPSLAAGGALTSAAPLAHVSAIAEAVDAPLSIFQYPLGSGCGYNTETLVLLSRIPNVIAIKEGSDTMMAYEDTWRHVKQVSPDVAILPSNYDWFLPQLAVGADGLLSGLASLVPHMLVEIWEAARKTDLAAMREVSDRLYPVVRGIYGRPPRMDMHTRIKAGLLSLGLIRSARPRGPLLPVGEAIAAEVARIVEEADLARHVGRN